MLVCCSLFISATEVKFPATYINQGTGDNCNYDLILKDGSKISIQKIGCGLCSCAMGAEIQFGLKFTTHAKLKALAQYAINKGWLTKNGMGYAGIDSLWKYLRNSRDEEDLKLEMVVFSDEQDNRSEQEYVKSKLWQRVPVIVHRTGHYYLLTGIKKDSAGVIYVWVQDPGARAKSNKWTKITAIYAEAKHYILLKK